MLDSSDRVDSLRDRRLSAICYCSYFIVHPSGFDCITSAMQGGDI